MTRKACARLPWRIVEVQSCVVPYAVACCFVLLYFSDGDGRDYIHTTVRSLRTDQRVGPRWDRWETRLQYYIDARGITVDNRKRALLLHLAGPAVQDIFATFSDTGSSHMERLPRWTLILLLRRVYNSNDTPFARLIKRPTNWFLDT